MTNEDAEIQRYLGVLATERKEFETLLKNLPSYFQTDEGKALYSKLLQSVQAWKK